MIKFIEYDKDTNTPILEVDITEAMDIDYDDTYDKICSGYESGLSLINYLDRSKVKEFMISYTCEYTNLVYHSETTNEISRYQLQALIHACNATDIDWLKYILEAFNYFIDNDYMTIEEDKIKSSKPITIRMVEFTADGKNILFTYSL